MTYRTEFPDFDPTTLPAIPDGWTDQSWHNDACPSFNTGRGMVVFIDFARVTRRQIDMGGRFVVAPDPETDDRSDALLVTDDWSAVLLFVESSQRSAR